MLFRSHGTGLGLASVYGAVKQAGGHIEVESAAGQGTTFTIFLPMSEEPLPVATTPMPVASLPQGKETVLVVDDEAGVRLLAARVLRGCGYTVVVAETAEEALRLQAEYTGPIHLLFTDVVMPGLGGRELALQMKETRPELKVLFTQNQWTKLRKLVSLIQIRSTKKISRII